MFTKARQLLASVAPAAGLLGVSLYSGGGVALSAPAGKTNEQLKGLAGRVQAIEDDLSLKTAAPQPKLIFNYFPIPGRGELTRLALTVSGADWEDRRLAGPAWGALKASVQPYGQLPFLEIEGSGQRIFQSDAIARYAARQGDGALVPGCPLQEALSNEFVEAFEDVLAPIIPTFALKGEAQLAARAELCNPGGKLFETLRKIEARLAESPTGLVAATEGLTLGDLALFCATSMISSGWLDGVPLDILRAFPLLAEHRRRVGTDQRVAAFYAKETDEVRSHYRFE